MRDTTGAGGIKLYSIYIGFVFWWNIGFNFYNMALLGTLGNIFFTVLGVPQKAGGLGPWTPSLLDPPSNGSRSYITSCGDAASCPLGVKCFTLWILSRQPITRNTTKQGNSIYVWSEWQVKHEVMSVHGPAKAVLHATITFTSGL